jgi:glycosyltransferase involved in cell wall biosynthesis
MSAGFDHARGSVIITLDGDLQNDPAEIPRMLAKLDEGYDIVAGWRKDRQDKALSRKLPSRIANWIISRSTNVMIHDFGCTLKALRSEVVRDIRLYGEMHRFIPAIAAERGFSIVEIPVNHRARVFGTSKYGISRTFRVVLDLLTVRFFHRFATRPLHMFGAVGLGTGIAGALLFLWLCAERFVFDEAIGGRPLLLVSVMLMLMGLQFVCFGLLAEMMARTYHESQQKKIYALREVIECGAARAENGADAGQRVAS